MPRWVDLLFGANLLVHVVPIRGSARLVIRQASAAFARTRPATLIFSVGISMSCAAPSLPGAMPSVMPHDAPGSPIKPVRQGDERLFPALNLLPKLSRHNVHHTLLFGGSFGAGVVVDPRNWREPKDSCLTEDCTPNKLEKPDDDQFPVVMSKIAAANIAYIVRIRDMVDFGPIFYAGVPYVVMSLGFHVRVHVFRRPRFRLATHLYLNLHTAESGSGEVGLSAAFGLGRRVWLATDLAVRYEPYGVIYLPASVGVQVHMTRIVNLWMKVASTFKLGAWADTAADSDLGEWVPVVSFGPAINF